MVPSEIVPFLLRLLSGLLLLAFVALVFRTLQQDMSLTAAQVTARKRKHGRLVVISADDVPVKVGTEFLLLPVTTFGRAPANTVHLPDSFASNHHALLTLRTGIWWLEDRDSRNGTMLNDQLLESPTVVSAGDIIGVGRVQLKLELESVT